MTTYSRHQVVVILALVVAGALGIAIGRWRNSHPDLVDAIERFDQSTTETSSTPSSPGDRDGRKPRVPRESPTRQADSAGNATSSVLNTGGNPPPRRSSKFQVAAGQTGGEQAPLVDLNRASAPELMRLPGVGPALAARIIAARDADGPFTSVDDLRRVAGIGAARIARFRELVTVSP